MQMQKFYRSILGNLETYLGFPSKDLIHEELKVGYKIITTTKFTSDDWYRYLDYTTQLIVYCFDIGFDSDLFKYDGVKYIKDGKCFKS